MTRQTLSSLIAITVLLGACSQSPLEQSKAIATQYLEAVKAGDTATAMSLYCNPGAQELSPIKTVKSFTVEPTGESTDQGVSFNTVEATVVSVGLTADHTDKYTIWVMTPQQAIAHEQAAAARFAELGMRPEPINPEEWSKADLCVAVLD